MHPSFRLALASVLLLSLAQAGCGALSLQPREIRYDPGPARAQYRSMMKGQRVARGPSPRVTAESKLREGDRYQRQGDLQRAVIAYFESASLDPQDIDARLRLAYLQLQANPERAVAEFEKLSKEMPDRAAPWVGIGLARLTLSDLEAARVALEQARSLDPESAHLHSALGAVYDRMGAHEAAREALQRASELQPDGAVMLNNLAVSHLLTDEPREAEALLRRAAELDPENLVIRNNLGLAVGLQRRYDEALQIFRKATDERSAQNNLGYVYYLNGRLEEAIETYERALLARGEQAPTVLHNLETAQLALESRGAPGEPAPPPSSDVRPVPAQDLPEANGSSAPKKRRGRPGRSYRGPALGEI